MFTHIQSHAHPGGRQPPWMVLLATPTTLHFEGNCNGPSEVALSLQ